MLDEALLRVKSRPRPHRPIFFRCDIFGLRRPTTSQPVIAGLLDPCTNRHAFHLFFFFFFFFPNNCAPIQQAAAQHPRREGVLQRGRRAVHPQLVGRLLCDFKPGLRVRRAVALHQPRHRRGGVGALQGTAPHLPKRAWPPSCFDFFSPPALFPCCYSLLRHPSRRTRRTSSGCAPTRGACCAATRFGSRTTRPGRPVRRECANRERELNTSCFFSYSIADACSPSRVRHLRVRPGEGRRRAGDLLPALLRRLRLRGGGVHVRTRRLCCELGSPIFFFD